MHLNWKPGDVVFVESPGWTKLDGAPLRAPSSHLR